MVLTRLERQLKVGTNERATKLGNELFTRLAFIAPLLATELAVKT